MSVRASKALLRLITTIGALLVLWQGWTLLRDHTALVTVTLDAVATELALQQAGAEIVRAPDFEERLGNLIDEDDLATAESYAALAATAGVALPPDLSARLARAQSPWIRLPADAGAFLRGFVFGESDDMAELSGAIASDLMVIGDLRDLGTAGLAYANDEPVDEVIVALSAMGVALSAGTIVTVGGTAPLKFGAGTLKRLLRAGRLPLSMVDEIKQLAKRALPPERFGAALGDVLAIRPLQAGPSVGTRIAGRISANAEPQAWARLRQITDDVGQISHDVGHQGLWRLAKQTTSSTDLAKLRQLTPIAGKRTLALDHALGPAFKNLAKTSLKWGARAWLQLVTLVGALAMMAVSMVLQAGAKRALRLAVDKAS